MFSGRIEKNRCPVSLIIIRMRDGADTRPGAVLFKLICLNSRPLIKRMPRPLFCLFPTIYIGVAQDLWSHRNLSVIKSGVIHAVVGRNVYCKHSLGIKLQEKDFETHL